MPKTHPPYSPEFRRQMVDLVRAGRDPADLAREFEPTAQSISHWVAQADRQEGRREEKGGGGGLTAAERDELARLRRENKQLRLGARHPLSSCCLVRTRDRHDPVRVFEFISAHQAVFPVAVMARVLGVSEAGFHAWRPTGVCSCRRRCGAAEADPDDPCWITRDLWCAAGACRAPGRRGEAR